MIEIAITSCGGCKGIGMAGLLDIMVVTNGDVRIIDCIFSYNHYMITIVTLQQARL